MKIHLCLVALAAASLCSLASCQKHHGIVELSAKQGASPEETWACQWYVPAENRLENDYWLYHFWLDENGEWKGRKQIGSTHWLLNEIQATETEVIFREGDRYTADPGDPVDVLGGLAGEYAFNKLLRSEGRKGALVLADDRISAALVAWNEEAQEWESDKDALFTRRELLKEPMMWKFDVSQ